MTWCLLLLSHGAKEILGVVFWSFHSHPPGSAKKIIEHQQNGWTSKQFLKGRFWDSHIPSDFGIFWHRLACFNPTHHQHRQGPDASHWLRRPHSFRLGHPHQEGGAKGCKDRFQNIAIMITLIHIDSPWFILNGFTLNHIDSHCFWGCEQLLIKVWIVLQHIPRSHFD